VIVLTMVGVCLWSPIRGVSCCNSKVGARVWGRSGVLAFELPGSLAWPKSLLEQLENRQIQIARATFRQWSRDRQRPEAHPLDQSLPVR